MITQQAEIKVAETYRQTLIDADKTEDATEKDKQIAAIKKRTVADLLKEKQAKDKATKAE